MVQSIFEFRELEDAAELLDYFRLRHRVYCAEGYLQPQALSLDLDPFDARSRFVGAFCQGQLVAGARMILPQGRPHQQTLQRLETQGLIPTVETSTQVCNFQDIFALDPVFDYCATGDRLLVEFGRTVVLPQLRSTGLGLKLVYALYGLALHHGVKFGFAAVPPKLRGFYEKSACRVLEGQGVATKAGITSDLIAVVVDLGRLGGIFRAAYRAHRHFNRYRSWQVCSQADCLGEHHHFPGATLPAPCVSERLPSIEVHGWEPALQRLPLLRQDLQLQDETLNVGLHCPSVRNPSLEDKVHFLEALVSLGVETVNLGQPGLGGRAYQHSLALACQVASQRLPLAVSCTARPLASDLLTLARIAQKSGLKLEAAMAAGSGSQGIAESVGLAIREGLSVSFSVEDTSRTPPHRLEPLYHEAIQAGAQAIAITDSAGQANSQGTSRLVGFVTDLARRHGYQIRVDWHGSNDRGLAVGNCLAAIEAGAQRVHATALGVGERAGNASMERLLVQLHRLSGRSLSLQALQAYLGWASRNLALAMPTDMAALLSGQEAVEVTHEPALA
ncbi:GNAT family N-acetyltransferase [bacterium]|nr:GNAT family N-acetyltransferase [bacterium]